MSYLLPTFSCLLAVCVMSIITQTQGGYVPPPPPPPSRCCIGSYPSYGRCICKDGIHPDSAHKCLPPCNDYCKGKPNTFCNLKSFECDCKAGFIGNPRKGCFPPCGGDCITNAHCDKGTNKCQCNAGFIGDPKVQCFKPSVCEFTRSQYSVEETAGEVKIQVNRKQGIIGVVTVKWIAKSITATEDVDYRGIEGSVTFHTGENTESFTIQIVNDNIFEVDETFEVILTEITKGHRLGGRVKTVVKIHSEDKPCGGPCKKNEYCDQKSQKCVCKRGYVFWKGFCEEPCFNGCCEYAKCNVQTFKCYCIPGYYGNPAETCAKPSVFEIVENSYTVKENAGQINIVVKRIGSSYGNVKVTWVAKDISAIHGQDYVNHGGDIIFKTGVTSRTIQVKILNDLIYEKTETFSVKLTAVSTGGRFETNNVFTIVTILDDDEICGGHCGDNAFCNITTHKCECKRNFIGNPYDACRVPCGGRCLPNAKCIHDECVCNKNLVGDGITKCRIPCGGQCPPNSHSHCNLKQDKCVCDDHYSGDPFHGGCKCPPGYNAGY